MADPYKELKDFITVLAQAEGAEVITDTAPQQCDTCDKVAELRPYGPNGECICFDCGMRDEETTKQQYLKRS